MFRFSFTAAVPLLTTLLFGCVGSRCQADNIPLMNASFELPAVPGGESQIVTDWTRTGTQGSGLLSETITAFIPETPFGTQWFFTDNRFGPTIFYQKIGTTMITGNYTLTALVGVRGELGVDSSWHMGVYVDQDQDGVPEFPLADIVSPVTPTYVADGSGALDASVTATDIAPGTELFAVLGTLGQGAFGQTLLDNIRLEGPPLIPEPGTLVLALAGLASGFQCRRRLTAPREPRHGIIAA